MLVTVFVSILLFIVGLISFVHWKNGIKYGPKYDPNDETVQFTTPPPLPPWLEMHFPFTRRIAKICGLNIHFVDERSKDFHENSSSCYTVIMLHGNPTWSFLWRKVIAQLVMRKRVRVIAPDLVGFGLSSKTSDSDLVGNINFQAEMIVKLVKALQLSKFCIVGQDWGGPIITAVAARCSDQVTAIVFGNTTILPPKRPFKTLFHRSAHVPILSDIIFRGFNFPVPVLHTIQGNKNSIGIEEKKAYSYPFTKWEERAGPLALARAVPRTPQDRAVAVLQEATEWAKNFKGKVALVWGMKDPILSRSLYKMKELFPNAIVVEDENSGHFLQEEIPEKIASCIVKVAYPE